MESQKLTTNHKLTRSPNGTPTGGLLSGSMQKKLNRIYAYVEAMQRVEKILEPLWSEYINEQNIIRKKIIWNKIEKFEAIQNNLNEQYLKRS